MNSGPGPVCDFYRPIVCTDASELNAHVREWNGDFAQLSAGSFHANGGLAQLGAVSVVRLGFDQTILNRSYAPANSVAFLFPGQGSGASFVRGREIDPTQCVAIANDACCEAITNGHFVVMAAAIDLDFWNAQSHWLRTDSVASIRSARIISRAAWRNSVESSINWIFGAIAEHPEAFNREDVRASLSDRFLVTLANLSQQQDADIESTRDARISRRRAVERARAYIFANLSEPIRLSDLCRHAHVQARTLEYGFREVSGLSPVAYIRALRLSKVRKVLVSLRPSGRSISDIACDHGFWHLSQFSVDYRRFFGESPSVTRMRANPKSSAIHRTDVRASI